MHVVGDKPPASELEALGFSFFFPVDLGKADS